MHSARTLLLEVRARNSSPLFPPNARSAISLSPLHTSAAQLVPSSTPHVAASFKPALAHNAPPLRMVMFGKPGAGKGTLSTRLVERYNIAPISTGDLLRAEVRAQTALGRKAEEIMAAGGILDDHVVLQLVSKKLDELRAEGIQNWILDGFPRTLGQGRLLDPLLRKLMAPLTLVINLDVPDEVILSRIADRWLHLPSGRVYNLGYNKPKVPGRDDITGEPLTKRTDDKPETAARRLAQFYKSTSPLLEYYTSQAHVITPSALSSLSRIPAPGPSSSSLVLTSITGRTSDEIWPVLQDVVSSSFNVRERTTLPPNVGTTTTHVGKAPATVNAAAKATAKKGTVGVDTLAASADRVVERNTGVSSRATERN